jgi:hypothetical protein
MTPRGCGGGCEPLHRSGMAASRALAPEGGLLNGRPSGRLLAAHWMVQVGMRNPRQRRTRPRPLGAVVMSDVPGRNQAEGVRREPGLRGTSLAAGCRYADSKQARRREDLLGHGDFRDSVTHLA